MKKLLIHSIWALLLTFMLTVVAFAAGKTYTEGALWYTIEDNSITITGYFGREPEVTVPSVIAGKPVNVIGAGAFVGTDAVKVYLPDTIMTVEEGAVDAGVTLVYNSNLTTPHEVGGKTDQTSGPSDLIEQVPNEQTQTEAGSEIYPMQPNPADERNESDEPGEEAEINIDAVEAADEVNHRKSENAIPASHILLPVIILIVVLSVMLIILFVRKKERESNQI